MWVVMLGRYGYRWKRGRSAVRDLLVGRVVAGLLMVNRGVGLGHVVVVVVVGEGDEGQLHLVVISKLGSFFCLLVGGGEVEAKGVHASLTFFFFFSFLSNLSIA
jgi:hypothetical protein